MFLLHKLLAKLGYQTDTYKNEIFKAQYPQHIVISTKVYDSLGRTHDFMDYSWKEYRIADINGQGIFFAKGKQKVYMAVGKAEMHIQIDEFTVTRTASDHCGMQYTREASLPYHVVFDAVASGVYRFRFNSEKHELEIVYERGDEHKIYTFS